MSQWGVIRDDENRVHIAPLLADGRLDVRHSLHEFCPCGVREEMVTEDASIWIHRDPEKGGANA
jgi:hypothetical protein